MIMQFRVLDHKMERCSLVAAIPTEAEIRGRHRDNNVDLDGDTLVHVYRLDAARKLDARTLSYATKPKRLDHVGHFTVKLGTMNGTAEFDCKERTLQTFEVTCPGKRCHINFWQNRDSPVMGALHCCCARSNMLNVAQRSISVRRTLSRILSKVQLRGRISVRYRWSGRVCIDL